MADTRPHVLMSATAMWSHTRGLTVFATKIATERKAVVTLLVPHWMSTFNKANSEVKRCLADVENQKGEIRVIAFGEHSTSVDPAIMAGGDAKVFDKLWTTITTKSPLRCSATGVEYPAAAIPSLCVLDGFLYPWLTVLRASAFAHVPVLAWMSGSAAGIIRLSLPSRFGGNADYILPPFNEEELATGTRRINISGELTHIESCPEMYDWEFKPQAGPFTDVILHFEHLYCRMLHEADGVATTCTTGFDGTGSLAVLSKWAEETGGRPVFNVGPTMPFKPGTTDFGPATLEAEMKSVPSEVAEGVNKFLENALSTRGEASVVYICFGSFFWPTNPEHLWALLDKLAEHKVPFILSHSSPLSQVPDEVKERYASATEGLLIPWAPQQTVLAHKAIGWFLTHGGAGGTMDALTQGVPMIGWPFMADQPSIISYLEHTLDAAFQFVEVRTAPYGLKPIRARGDFTPTGTVDAFRAEIEAVLRNMKGDVGARKRRNAKRAQAEIAKAWTENGSATTALHKLVAKYGL